MNYIKELEEQNEQLQQKLALLEKEKDDVNNDKATYACSLLIQHCLDKQKEIYKTPYNNPPWINTHILKIAMPRQHGNTTSILKATSKIFKFVYYAGLDMNAHEFIKNTHNMKMIQLRNPGSVRGLQFECLIVDNFSLRFDDTREWNQILQSIIYCFKREQSLLILVG